MGSPLVSVLMPVYNGQRYLSPALDSVLGQSFGDFEFIVIDDGSTDRTPQILDACPDRRLKVFRLEHVGLIGALNEGVRRCAGRYIARMDGDDVSYSERLARQVGVLESHAEIDLVASACHLLDRHGKIVGQTTGGVGDDMILELAAGNTIVHGSIMVRRDALPPPPVYPGPPEDYRLWVQLARAGKRFHSVSDVLYGFRTHDDRFSLTHAQGQSAGIVATQWPLLEECMATRDLSQGEVRARLVRGWGGVAGAAYRAGNSARSDAARRRFLELAGSRWDQNVAAPARYGIEAMIWGGCPWPRALALRWLAWRNQPMEWTSYRNLLLALPPVAKLRTLVRRGRGSRSGDA